MSNNKIGRPGPIPPATQRLPDSPTKENTVAALRNFCNGDTSVLDTPDLIEDAASYLFTLYHNGNMQQALLLLEQLGEATLSSRPDHRERSLIALCLVAENVLEENNIDLLEAIARLLVRWLKHETEFISGFEFICRQLGRLLYKMAEMELWFQLVQLTATIRQVKRGRIAKDKLIRQVVGRTQKTIAQPPLLTTLAKTYIDQGNEKSAVAGEILVQLGDPAIIYLLETLLHCPEKDQRLRLLDLFSSMEEDAIPHLTVGLERTSPWYFTRNLLTIMSRVGTPEFLPSVLPYLKHRDLRIQQEALLCINNISGEEKSQYLLDALNAASHEMKPRVIRMLGPLHEQRVGNAFAGLLKHAAMFDKKIRNDIIIEVCRYLPSYPTTRSLEALRVLLTNTEICRELSQEASKSIENCLSSLKKKLGTPPAKQASQTGTQGSPPPKSPNPRRNQPTLSDNDIPKWLPHVYEQADTEEYIRDHLRLRWDFYQQFTHEEFLVFTSLLQHRTYTTDELLTAVGDVHSTLFFLEEGEVALHFPDSADIMETSNLVAGDVFGHDVFMDGSEWEVSLVARTPVKALLFDQEQLLRLQTVYPELSRRILNYSGKNDIYMKLYALERKRLEDNANAEIPFTGDIGEDIARAKVIFTTKTLLCFRFALPAGTDHSLFTGRELLLYPDEKRNVGTPLTAKTKGVKYVRGATPLLCLLARLDREQERDDWPLGAISL